MRKTFVTAFVMTLGGFLAGQAQSPMAMRPLHPFSQTLSPVAASLQRHQSAKAEENNSDDAADDDSATSMMFSYCYEPSGGLGGEPDYAYGLAIQLTDDVVEKFSGCRIVGIQVPNADYDDDKITTPAPYPISLFVSRELNGTPLSSQDVKEDTTNPGEWVEYALDTPVDIQQGEPLYVGFTCVATSDYYPLVMDNTKHTGGEPGCMLGYATSATGTLKWNDYSSYYGFACIRVHIEGENLPTNEIAIDEMYAPTQTQHGSGLTAEVKITNAASNPVRSVGVTYSINSGEPVETTINLSEPLTYSRQTVGQFEVKYDGPDADNIHVEFTLDKVNGEPNISTRNTGEFYTQAIDYDKAFTRNMLVEEGTGTWCQWCVRGIVAMEAMKEKGDAFIPVAVHYNDDMVVAAYKPVVRQYFSGFPASMINRDFMEFGDVDPTTENLEAVYSFIERRLFSIANVKIDGVELVDNNTLRVNSSVEFSLDNPEATYRMDYVVTEDQVGPYVQTNAYAGGVYGEMGGWEQLGSYVAHMYDDVARSLADGYGVESSLPEAIEAGKVYTHSQELDLANVSLLSDESHRKLQDCHIVAMLINTLTGRIENSVSVDAVDVISDLYVEEEGGIQSIQASTDDVAPVYYNLQGMPVANPTPGHIYISRGQKLKM